MTSLGDWEIWAGQGFALLVLKDDPDKAWLTRVCVRKYGMDGVSRERADAVFTRALRGGYLIHWPKPLPAPLPDEDE